MDSVTTSLVSGLTTLASDVMTALGSIVPVALPIAGVGIVCTIGFRLFKKIAN